jgi:hypothetical protein
MPENRVELAAQQEKYGMPMASIKYRVRANCKNLLATAAQDGVKVIKSAGAR